MSKIWSYGWLSSWEQFFDFTVKMGSEENSKMMWFFWEKSAELLERNRSGQSIVMNIKGIFNKKKWLIQKNSDAFYRLIFVNWLNLYWF